MPRVRNFLNVYDRAQYLRGQKSDKALSSILRTYKYWEPPYKIILHGDLAPSICTPLQSAYYAGKNIKFKLVNMHQTPSCNACNIQDVSHGFGKNSGVNSPHHNTVRRSYQCMSANRFQGTAPTFAQTQSFRF